MQLLRTLILTSTTSIYRAYTQDDDSGSSIPWVTGRNPQETRRFWPEPAGKCQEFDAGIR